MNNLNQKELEGLVKISKFAGERFDLVQAGGGNSSVKFGDGSMAIKASGFALSDVDLQSGYAIVKNDAILKIFKKSEIINLADKNKRDENIKSMVEAANLTKNIRPSIEVFLHAVLAKYTLHTHSIAANNILCSQNWQKIIADIFTGENFVAVPYHTPGIGLAVAMQEKVQEFYQQNGKLPEIIFMQNHGIIISLEDANSVIATTESVILKIENYLGVSYDYYKTTNKISALVNKSNITNLVSYLSEDQTINEMLIKNSEIFNQFPTCPDVLVFCGASICKLDDFQDQNSIINFTNKYNQLPKVVICNNQIFFIAKNIAKAKEVEEVFKFHLLVLKNLAGEKNFLSKEETSYLLNWEAEKFRQNLRH